MDRLTLTFPARDVRAEKFSRTTTTRFGDGEQVALSDHCVLIREPSPDGERPGKPLAGVHVGATEVEGVTFLRVDANPARLFDPSGHSLLPVDKLEAAAEVMWSVAASYAEPKCDPEDANVTRADVTRDFPLSFAPAAFYVRGLQNIHRPYARRVGVWSSAAHGNAETLHVGSGAGMVRLYDQEAAYGVQGGLRWECEARKGWLNKDGKTRLRDLTGYRLEAIARNRWEWSRMGTRVDAAVSVVEAIEAKVCRCPGRGCLAPEGEHLTRAKADRLLGQLVREAYGVGTTARRTATRYEPIKRALGSVPSADLFADGFRVEYAGRLDFDTGREVAA